MPDATALPSDVPSVFLLPTADQRAAGGTHGSAVRGALRAMTHDDWTLEQDLSRDAAVQRWTFYPADLSADDARTRAALAVDRRRTGASARFVVLDDDGPAGTAGIAIPRGVPEVFYALLPRARGRGLASRAARTLSSWALRAGYPEVHLFTLEGNTASEAVAERAGFTRGETATVVRDGIKETTTCWVRR
ncbi:GNAT family N-acetyltransferase [Luteimicrobium subarcticum]|uniref:RimJ/RimL family protein N-acetyltransferase n=1 Tax=Luteimicrobium subarcticum TaxID=620910 RepID=A0A2M8WSV8_9MICO|nr:GNAT family N-acetyltransferase [Luteimicrobium subarcticum]PJI93916.1 RimJ/RimL family protein N-acetyltransferase [Luteimicrobium subarcticum]